MEERMVEFIAGLRASGVRISVAESADAFRAVEALGVQDRERFREALQATLIKEPQDLATFERLFPQFFGLGGPPMFDATQDLSDADLQSLADAIRQFTGKVREQLERLLRGEALTQEELEELGRMVGLNRSTHPYQQPWLTSRMLRALGNDEVKKALKELWELLDRMGMDKRSLDRLRQLVQANQDALREQVGQFVGSSIARNALNEPRDALRGDDLMQRPFQSLSEREAEELRKQVQRLAAQLRSRAALRQRRGKVGQLDVKRTLRTNLKYGGVPLELKYRQRQLKPKILLICDVSTSMRPVVEFMLRLMYDLQDQVAQARSFAFIDDIQEITADFMEFRPDVAIDQVLGRLQPGYYNTDLGQSLLHFQRDFLDAVDHRTTVIVVGDGRNNYNNPEIESFNDIKRRARRLIWLTPESPMLWGSGDSDMLRYLPFCSAVFEVNNMASLAEAVDRMLTTH
ncbi:vWA domain-containing protein [Candidatus Amarolinea aalborgensis]|uniref:vWA domain-containing protein n=1 Tax=Candidatus Amarolinea aalborgensis TaxID=2249329 RepID=UPI003BF953F9